MTLTPFDRLEEQVKFMVGRFQEHVNLIDEQKKLISDSANQSKEHCEKLESKLESYIEDLDQSQKSYQQEVSNEISKLNLANGVSYAKVSSKINDLIDGHSFIADEINECKSCISKINEIEPKFFSEMNKVAKVDDVKRLYIDVVNLKDSIPQLEENIKTISKTLCDLDLDLNHKISTFPTQIKDLSVHVDDLQSAINVVSIDLSNFRLESKTNLNNLYEKLNLSILDSISKIPTPEIPSLEEAKKSMQTMVEPIGLDAKNAYLRSSNNEIKINLLEKKIEQLQILINKLQIQA